MHFGRLPTWLMAFLGVVIVGAGLAIGRPALLVAGVVVLAATALRFFVGAA